MINKMLFSPLEQFQNASIAVKFYKPVIPEVYLQWSANSEIDKMMLCETDFFFNSEDFFFFFDKIEYILFVLIASSLFVGAAYISSQIELMKYINKDFFFSWLITMFFLYFTTFSNTSFDYVTVNFPVAGTENLFTVEVLIIPNYHGGLLFTDTLSYFLTAMFLLYLCTGFQDYHNSKAPYIVNTNILTYIQVAIHKVTVELLSNSIDKEMKTQSYHVFIYFIFTYITISNLQGLVPFGITVTSHLIITFFLAQTIMIYVTATIIAEQGVRYLFSLFMPSGTPLLLGYLLVPIEIVSFFFKAISLSVRLFANMMAGHTLLKVILGFAWVILSMSEVYFIVNLFPVIILILLTCLEIGVSIIQAYIFSILTCLYLRDAFAGH